MFLSFICAFSSLFIWFISKNLIRFFCILICLNVWIYNVPTNAWIISWFWLFSVDSLLRPLSVVRELDAVATILTVTLKNYYRPKYHVIFPKLVPSFGHCDRSPSKSYRWLESVASPSPATDRKSIAYHCISTTPIRNLSTVWMNDFVAANTFSDNIYNSKRKSVDFSFWHLKNSLFFVYSQFLFFFTYSKSSTSRLIALFSARKNAISRSYADSLSRECKQSASSFEFNIVDKMVMGLIATSLNVVWVVRFKRNKSLELIKAGKPEIVLVRSNWMQ